MPGVVRGAPNTASSNTNTQGRWQGTKFIPSAGSANDAEQLNYLHGEANSAGSQGKGFSSNYTDSQGRMHSVGTPAKEYAPGTSAQDPTGFDTKMSQFGRFTNTFGNLFGGGNGNLSGSGTLTHGDAPRVQLDTNAINNGDAAAFSQAKDKVGGSMQGLMKSLQGQFAGRGLRGSSIEGRAVSSGLESGMGQLDDVARSQAVEGSRRAVDLAKTQYGGEIEQRGQDIGAETATRQFQAQQQQSKLASIMGLWNAFSGGLKY
jgi:hypothetical protein